MDIYYGKSKFCKKFNSIDTEVIGMPMMNFEDKVQGWNIIFKGLISPFANKFKNYIQLQMNSEIHDNDEFANK